MINGLIEVILYVQDMQAQVSFYRDILGLEVSDPGGLQDYSKEMWVTLNTGDCTLALHAGGGGELGKDSPKIVFGVKDIRKARDVLSERGVDFGDVRAAAPGVWVCDGVDLEGNPISIEAHE